MKIGILAPVSTEEIKHLLHPHQDGFSSGYPVAPFVSTLIEEFIRQGHDVVAFTTDRTISPEKGVRLLEGPKLRLWLCPSRPNGTIPTRKFPIARIWDFFSLERKFLAAALSRESLDILHAHWTYEFAMAAAATGNPYVVTVHDAPSDIVAMAPSPYTIGRYLMARKVVREARHISVVSPYVKKVTGKNNQNVTVIGNPLPSSLTGSELRVVPKKNFFIVSMVLGGWTKFKNPLPGILGFLRVADKLGKGARLNLFGIDYGPGGKAERKIRKLGLPTDNIRFFGQIPHHQVLSEISDSSVLLHTSLTESFGMAVAEAMSLGVPVIGGNGSGAIPWLLDRGKAGYLVDVKNEVSISNALLSVYSGGVDVERKRQVAKSHIGAICNAEKIAGEYISFYRRALNF